MVLNKLDARIRWLEEGIIPHVIMCDDRDEYKLEIPYEEAETDITGTESEELKKSLHAGKIPEAEGRNAAVENRPQKPVLKK